MELRLHAPGLALALLLPAGAALAAAQPALEEIVITARLREQPALRVPASISVVAAAQIDDRQARHFEQLLNLAPNINYTAGASRGRFVQMRGIGERSQFVDPVDPSVGLYIDGIDMSGLGNAGTLFDVSQVEILRGPQGTAFGASALAGLINIRSGAPTQAFEAALSGGLSRYGGTELGGVLSGPLADSLGARLALFRHRSDGFMRNDHLHRDDTNDIDETTLRARLDWQATQALRFELTGLRVDADNGYDAFSLDDNRHTLSDQPGRDLQRSDALALRARYDGWDGVALEAVATWNDSELDYGYDEDWSFPGLCTGTPCEGWEYASTDRYLRGARAHSLDIRLLSQGERDIEWVAGVYGYRRDTALERRYTYLAADFASDYETTHLAAYGEASWHLAPRLALVAGLRAVRWDADYVDSLAVRAQPQDTLWGGQLSLQYDLAEDAMAYLLWSRGFKAGGVNGEAIGKVAGIAGDCTAGGEAAPGAADYCAVLDFLRSRGTFEAETLDNLELGYKADLAGGRLQLRGALFWMRREDVQLNAWYTAAAQGGLPPVFVGYRDNGARGENYGLELEGNWQAHDRLRLDAGLGLLGTSTDGVTILNAAGTRSVERGREAQAQSPRWQFHLGAELALARQAYLRLDWEGKDAYYFSDSDDQHSGAYALLHAALGWRGERIDASAWVHNVFDRDYAVHGFLFGNDPRSFYATESWHQYGEPRVAGVSITLHL